MITGRGAGKSGEWIYAGSRGKNAGAKIIAVPGVERCLGGTGGVNRWSKGFLFLRIVGGGEGFSGTKPQPPNPAPPGTG